MLARAGRIATAAGFAPFSETSLEVLGSEAIYGDGARPAARESREVVLKIAARHEAEGALAILAREIAPAAAAMAQGLTGFFAGRPGVQPVYRGYSFLVPAEAVTATLDSGGESRTIASPGGLPDQAPAPHRLLSPPHPPPEPSLWSNWRWGAAATRAISPISASSPAARRTCPPSGRR